MARIPADLQALANKGKHPIWGTFSISLLIHVGLIALLGGIVIFKAFERPPAQFAPPPPPVRSTKIEPRKLEYKVKMQEQQRRGGRPTVSPRMTATGISSISMPEIKADIEPLKERVKASFKTSGLSGSGTGTGSGSGGGGGLGLGMSQVNMFGMKAEAERLAILIDVSPSMVQDEKGGVDGFTALKNELAKIIKSLSPGSFFNLVFFSTGVDVFKSELVIASNQNKEEAIRFCRAYYPDRNHPEISGLASNYSPKYQLPAVTATTRHDLALSAAFEFNVDTVFLVSDGNHAIYRPLTEEERKVAEAKLAVDMKSQTSSAEQDRQLEITKRLWEKKQEERRKRGLPPQMLEAGGAAPSRGGVTITYPKYNDKDVIDFLNKLVADVYTPKNKKAPKVYCFGYVTTPQEESFMREMSRQFKGRFKRFNALVRPIKE